MTDTSKTTSKGAMRAAKSIQRDIDGRAGMDLGMIDDEVLEQMAAEFAEIIDRETHAGEMVHLLGALTLLIRNMGDIYGVKAANWLIEKQLFQDAERLLKELEG